MQNKKLQLKNQRLVIPSVICIGFSAIALAFNSITLYIINTLLYACLPFAIYHQYKKYYSEKGDS